MMRTYSELIKLPTFEERFEYLKLGGGIGDVTFGSLRYYNQLFYTSKEWRKIRDDVIIRDRGFDLAVEPFEVLKGEIFIHHMNPLTPEDILNHTELLTNPEYLILCSKKTHNAIHYGDPNELPVYSTPVTRFQNDTCLWKKGDH